MLITHHRLNSTLLPIYLLVQGWFSGHFHLGQDYQDSITVSEDLWVLSLLLLSSAILILRFVNPLHVNVTFESFRRLILKMDHSPTAVLVPSPRLL